MENVFKKEKGFTTVDLAIALIIIVLFVTVMSSLIYNIYVVNVEAKRTAVALNYAVDIFEYIGISNFDEVVGSYEFFDNITGLEDFTYENVTSSTIKGSIDDIYSVTINIEDYKDGNVLKIITLTIEYKVSNNNTETMELQRVKQAEE